MIKICAEFGSYNDFYSLIPLQTESFDTFSKMNLLKRNISSFCSNYDPYTLIVIG